MHGAYILARYSTDRQNEDTIEVQVERCSEWCQKQGLPVLDIFADMAVSGMKDTRPQYARMMEQLKQGGADTVVIYDQSRMFRKMTAWFIFREELENMGVRVISVTQPAIGGDLRDPSNFLIEGSAALFNQMWVLQTRQKVTEKMRYMARSGQHTGGIPALGYCIKDGRLEIEPTEAEVVRKIFSMYAAGKAYREIIEALNREGIRTKTGRPFGNNSLHDILKNEKYIGVLVYGKTKKRPDGRRNSHGEAGADCIRIEDGCPAIVDKDIFRAVQERMKQNKTRGGGRPVNREEQPLKGKVFCGECGSAMNVSYSGRKPNVHAYYECGAKRRLHNCTAKQIRKDALETAVADMVREQLRDPVQVHNLATILRQQRARIQAESGPKMEAMVKRLRGIERRLDNATEAVLSGLNSSAIREKISRLEADKAKLENEINAYHAEVLHTTVEDSQIERLIGKVVEYSQESNAALLAIVTRVEVYAEEIVVYTILDGPPDGEKPKIVIDKSNIAEMSAVADDTHNCGCPTTGTKPR